MVNYTLTPVTGEGESIVTCSYLAEDIDTCNSVVFLLEIQSSNILVAGHRVSMKTLVRGSGVVDLLVEILMRTQSCPE